MNEIIIYAEFTEVGKDEPLISYRKRDLLQRARQNAGKSTLAFVQQAADTGDAYTFKEEHHFIATHLKISLSYKLTAQKVSHE